MGASSGQGRWGSQIKKVEPTGSYLPVPGVSNYLRLVAWNGLGEVGWDGCGCGFSVRSLLIAGLQEEWLFFFFLMGKKERGVLFAWCPFFLIIKLNGVKQVAYGE